MRMRWPRKSSIVRTGRRARVDRTRAGIVEGQADETVGLERGQDFLADRAVDDLVEVIGGPEQERQRQHVQHRRDIADGADIDAIDVDGADAGLLDGLALLAELPGMEDPDAVALVGPLA